MYMYVDLSIIVLYTLYVHNFVDMAIIMRMCKHPMAK